MAYYEDYETRMMIVKPAVEKAGHAATVLTMDALPMSRTKKD